MNNKEGNLEDPLQGISSDLKLTRKSNSTNMYKTRLLLRETKPRNENLTKEDFQVTKSLKRKESFLNLPSDTNKKLKENSTQRSRWNVKQVIKKLTIQEDTKWILCKCETFMAGLHSLSKIHKPRVPLTLTISRIGSVT